MAAHQRLPSPVMTMMTLVFVPTALAMLVGTPAPTAWQPRAPPAVALASSSGELPNMYRERWSGEKETSSVVAKVTDAPVHHP